MQIELLRPEPDLPIDPSTAFVSYSREDLEFVLRLAKDLKAKGAKVWMDKLDLRAGQLWDTEVEVAVDQCSRMLVILSPAAAASQKVKNEFMAAMDEGKEVIPVYFRECKIPLQLRRLQYADFRLNYSFGLEELLASLSGQRTLKQERILAPPEPPAPEPGNTPSKLPLWAKGGAAVLAILVVGWLIYLASSGSRQKEPVGGASKQEVPAQTPAPGTTIPPISNERTATSPTTEAAAPTGMSAKVADLYRKAQAGDSTAMVDLGLAYDKGDGVQKDAQQAFAWDHKAAEAGNSLGMYNVGVDYRDGIGVKLDYSQAFTWFRNAAQAGDARAMNNLGAMYRDGQGVTQDYPQAASWFSKAAEAGNEMAMTSLGWLYHDGRGVPRDYQKAAFWTRKAAEAGDAQGINNLGALYEDGHGVNKNLEQALAWYRKAAKLGNQQAKENLKRLRANP